MSLDVFALNAMLEVADAVTAIRLINLSGESFTKDGMVQILEGIGGSYARLAKKGAHIILDDTQYNRQLAERLKNLGMVSSIMEKKNKVKINMKKKW